MSRKKENAARRCALREATRKFCEPLERRMLLAATDNLLHIAPGFPRIFYDTTGSLNYTASTHEFIATAAPNTAMFQSTQVVPSIFTNGILPRSVRIDIILDSSGNLASGVSGPDLLVQGKVRDPQTNVTYDGVLIKGEAAGFGWLESGTTTDDYDFRFTIDPTSLLASYFASADVGITLHSLNSTFTGDFSKNFVGKTNGTIGTIDQPPHPVPSSLSGMVFSDFDNDGDRHNPDAGIAGVTLTLTGTDSSGNVVNRSTVTDADGMYLFDNLAPSDASGYSIAETQPFPPYLDGKDSVGTLGGNASVNDKFSQIVLGSGIDGVSYNFAEILPASASGFVYHDANDNGLRDDGATSAIASATTHLTGIDDLGASVNLTATTDSSGYYEFTGLRPSDGDGYTIHEDQPAGYLDGQDTPGSGLTSLNQSNDEFVVAVSPANAGTEFNFGELLAASVGDRVFRDLNANGVQDSGEPGVPGVGVRLFDSGGNPIGSPVTTDANGNYGFSGLDPNSYYLQFSTSDGGVFTTQDQGSDDAVDSDANASTGQTTLFVLASGQNDPTRDAGILPIDLSLTKSVDSSTPNVGSNVSFTISLSNGAGFSAASGVKVTDLLPAGLVFVSATASTGTAYDSSSGVWDIGAVGSGGSATLSIVATATAGARASVINTAEVTAASQPDLDSSPNNHNASEDDQASATVSPQLIDLSLTKTVDNATPNVGQNVAFTITLTNSDGFNTATGVSVSDLLPTGLTFASATAGQGSYNSSTGVWTVGSLSGGTSSILILRATATTAARPSVTNTAEVITANQPDVDSTPNNHVTAEDDQASVAVSPQQIDLSVTKTVDNATPNVNSNVTFTITLSNAAGFNTASGVIVKDLLPAGLTFVSASAASGTTYVSSTGLWTVGSINSGTSKVLTITATVTAAARPSVINLAELTAATQPDIDSTPNNHVVSEDDQAQVTVTPPAAASLGNFVWEDLNGNGLQDSGEPGIVGVSVGLYTSSNALLSSTSTGTGGIYGFVGLNPGSYYLIFATPGGYVFTSQNVGADAAIDSDANGAGKTLTFSLVAGQNDTTRDAGLYRPSVISGKKYLDVTGNGLTADDTPLAGTTIKLYRDMNKDGVLSIADGNPVATTTSAVTTGIWSFSGLQPGRFFVQEVVPTGYIRTGPTNTDTYTLNVTSGTTSGGNNFCNFYIPICHITNIKYCVDGVYYTDLAGHTHEGSIVKVTFTVPYGYSDTVNLVAYKAPSASFDPNTATQQVIFQQAGGKYTAGTYTISVTLPKCYYQVDFVCGTVIDHFGPVGSNVFYTQQNRLDSADNGGTNDCVDKMCAAPSYWCSSTKGQLLIKAFNGGSTARNLATWLSTGFPKLYGSTAGSCNLVNKTNADVAALMVALNGNNQRSADAQVLATALGVYATTTGLGGTTATSYGFTVTAAGLGVSIFNTQSSGLAFGVANGTNLTVLQLLQGANAQTVNGSLYNGSSTLKTMAQNTLGLVTAYGGVV